ncbi:MAG: hypothetical protein GY703_25945 [Gammaproteobacteria bacterium]|nr:hypothetical protein [Gammaproteobacteria bacterium]
MLHFISSLFTTDKQRSGLDEELINAAIERVVDGTDKRLRGFSNYRRRLRDAVEVAVSHSLGIVDAFGEPVEISTQAYRNDARLRACFASANRLREVMGDIRSIQNCLEEQSGLLPERLYGLLSMQWGEKQVFGMDIHNDKVRRDVMQVTVNFFNHDFIGPTANEEDTRWELKKRAFDFLVEQALANIVREQGKRGKLENQCQLQKQKLAKMQEGSWGLAGLSGESTGGFQDPSILEAEIASIEEQLLELPTRPASVEDNFDHIKATLGSPAECLFARELELLLDDMLIKRESTPDNPIDPLHFDELWSNNGEHRVVILGWIPISELPEKRDFLGEAARFLG